MPYRIPRALVGILALSLLAGPAGAEEDAAPAAPASVAAAHGETAGTTPGVDAATSADATRLVDELQANLLEVMKNAEALGYQGRYDRLAPVLPTLFDLSFMAEKSVGRYWKTASEEDRRVLVDTFTRYMIANYAGRFDGYSGQSFETLAVEPSARDTLLVRTRLHDPTGEDVSLDYRLRKVDGGWRIIDIYLNGTVSELALRRSEYSSLIKREGFHALLIALDERIETLATAPTDRPS
jgi:phospholipid transport system substrate-binding protein